MIVLDASAWVDVLTAGLDIPELGTDSVVVPPHFDVEVLGTIRALSQRELLSAEDAGTAYEQHLSAQFEHVHDVADIRRAWTWRHALSLADAWYVALAERLDATWITADQKAARTARLMDVNVQVV